MDLSFSARNETGYAARESAKRRSRRRTNQKRDMRKSRETRPGEFATAKLMFARLFSARAPLLSRLVKMVNIIVLCVKKKQETDKHRGGHYDGVASCMS